MITGGTTSDDRWEMRQEQDEMGKRRREFGVKVPVWTNVNTIAEAGKWWDNEDDSVSQNGCKTRRRANT
jgi:hypothetical protein